MFAYGGTAAFFTNVALSFMLACGGTSTLEALATYATVLANRDTVAFFALAALPTVLAFVSDRSRGTLHIALDTLLLGCSASLDLKPVEVEINHTSGTLLSIHDIIVYCWCLFNWEKF